MWPELDTPTLLVDLDVLDRNLRRMAERARAAGVRLRPHTKTHKSRYIAGLQLGYGAAGLTVAKLGEAEVMADAGFDDILVAYPVYGEHKLRRLKALAQRVRVTVSLDDPEVAAGIGQVGLALGRPLPIYVDVDTGQHRMGRAAGQPTVELALQLAKLPGVEVVGLMSHAGHAYGKDAQGRRQAALTEAQALRETAEQLRAAGLALPEISVGSTPTAEFVGEMQGVPTELRPGTYVFNDRSQVLMGVATEADCALAVLVTVVARPTPDRAIIDAGSKTLSADVHAAGGYGLVRGRPEIQVARLSEEHGVLSLPPGAPLAVGDRLLVVPNHVCPVVNLADVLVGVRGGRIERRITVDARGRNQ